MTLREIIKDKEYDIIEVRNIGEIDGKPIDTLFGYCRYHKGQLIPMDGDSYSLDMEVEKYEEWEDTDKNAETNYGTILTVWERVKFVSASQLVNDYKKEKGLI